MNYLPAKYLLLKRLDQYQAIQAIAESASVDLDVFTLAQACADAGKPATVDLPQTGISMRHGGNNRDFRGAQSIATARKGNPYNDLIASITIEAEGLPWEASIDLRSQPIWFAPASLEALIAQLRGANAETNELRQLRYELEQERITRQSLEVELTALREKPLEPRERASLERLVYVLAIEAGYRLIKPHADEQNIIEAAARHCAKVPAGKGTIAKFLEAAKTRAESERES
ncbi:hypothetical protein [Pseudomonas sp.]|uniref:hypothetical protein n=1 Tax=Pseudomonas sp. TaxID=306 RepID=UPI003FD77882